MHAESANTEERAMTKGRLLLMCLAAFAGCSSDVAQHSPDARTPVVDGKWDRRPVDSRGLEGGSREVGAVTCGNTTCKPSEYCVVECVCCGIPVDFALPPPKSYCLPIPSTCDPPNFCSCKIAPPGSTGCNCISPRTINCPCA